MKLATLAITVVSAGAAVVAGVGSYHAVAPAKTDTHLEAAVTPPVAGAGRTPPPLGTVIRFEDCPRGTELRGKVCVRLEERTVVEYVAAPVPVYQQVAPATSTRSDGSTYGGDDDGPGPTAPADDDGDRDERDDDRDEDGDEDRDHEDEDHGDEDHGDEHEDREDD